MSDVLIRDLPEDVLTTIDARAAKLGLTRDQYVHRQMLQDARRSTAKVTVKDLHRLADVFSDLTSPEVTDQAWK